MASCWNYYCCCFCPTNSNSNTSEHPSNNNRNATIPETELSNQASNELRIDRQFSSKTLLILDTDPEESSSSSSHGCIAKGSGLAIGSIPIEQDSAYWEIHILEDNSSSGGESSPGSELFEALQFGVSKRPRVKNQSIDEQENLSFTRSIPNLLEGDVVGVAEQQSDLPMVQFLVNGEPMHHKAINRFRGMYHYPTSKKRCCNSFDGHRCILSNRCLWIFCFWYNYYQSAFNHRW